MFGSTGNFLLNSLSADGRYRCDVLQRVLASEKKFRRGRSKIKKIKKTVDFILAEMPFAKLDAPSSEVVFNSRGALYGPETSNCCFNSSIYPAYF